MNILLHTIALEPARWTPQRVSRPLVEILPAIAAAGFYKLEIFEPHLTHAADEQSLKAQMAELHLVPLVLSSYMGLAPESNPDAAFEAQSAELLARVDAFGFRKVRLFPGQPSSAGMVAAVGQRLRRLADQRPHVEFLLETHDHSLADDALAMVRLMEQCARGNVGLLWQPVVFKAAEARAQLELQKDWVRHLHLQNRDSRDKFARLGAGVVPWGELIAKLTPRRDVTIEFVPSGICDPRDFDLTTSLQEAVEEFGYVVKLNSQPLA